MNYQIKEEITNDEEGIPLIARCVYKENLDFVTIQQTVLRIIDAISFGSHLAVEQIKENDLLMEYIKELEKKMAIPEVKCILWKTEGKDLVQKQENGKKSSSKTTKSIFDETKATYQYIRGDHHFRLNEAEPLENSRVMISYCYDDREVVKRLYQRLIKSNSCRVFFDVDNCHHSNPKAMAEAVERSMKIVMCFSNQYRNSYACRLEAEYAKERKRTIDFLRESNKGFEQIVEQINED